jgi:hypothetical protein
VLSASYSRLLDNLLNCHVFYYPAHVNERRKGKNVRYDTFRRKVKGNGNLIFLYHRVTSIRANESTRKLQRLHGVQSGIRPPR